MILFSSWACGGRLPWVPPVMAAIAVYGIRSLVLRQREHQKIRWLAFLPLLAWVLLIGIALANPSHTLDPQGQRIARSGWIPWLPTCIDPKLCLSAQWPWFTALLQGGLLAAAPLDRRAVRTLWRTATFNTFALAAAGSVVHLAGVYEMLGFISVPEPQYFFATFFYKNHWAAYGALGLFACGAQLLDSARHGLAGDPRSRDRALFLCAALVLTAITLPIPGSRSGAVMAAIAVLGTGIVGTVVLTDTRRWSRARRLTIRVSLLAVAAAGLGYGVHVYRTEAQPDWERTVRQLAGARKGELAEVRLLIVRDTWRMARARPAFGWGVGAYETVFQLYAGKELRNSDGRPMRYQFAHCDWLQLLAETGPLGLALIAGTFAVCVLQSWRRAGIVGRWGLSGCVLIAAYAWADFPLNNPAVVLLWTAMLTTAGEVSGGSRSPTHRRSGTKSHFLGVSE